MKKAGGKLTPAFLYERDCVLIRFKFLLP